MKRAIAVGAAALTALALASCSSGGDAGGDSSEGGSAEGATVAYVPGATTIAFYEMMADEGQKTAEAEGVEWVYQGAAEWSASLQTPVVDGVCTNKPDVLIITPTDGQGMAAALQRCIDAGIPVISVDTLADESTPVETAISADNLQGGGIAGEYMAEAIGGSGKVVVVGGPSTVTTNNQRAEGFAAAMAENYPDIEVMQTQWTESQDPAKAQSAVSDLLVANPDIKGLFCIVENVAEGCAAAVDLAGLDVQVIGYDASDSLVANLRSGKIDALVVQPARDESKAAVEAAVKFLNGESLEPEMKLENVLITTDTLDDPQFERFLK